MSSKLVRPALTGLLRKEITQFFRDPVMIGLILWLYTVEVILCTYALSFEVRHLPMAVVDHDRSVASRELVQTLLATEAFDPAGFPTSAAKAGRWLETGRATVALVVPGGFERELQAARAPRVQVLIDGANSNAAANARYYVLDIVHRFEKAASPLGAGGQAHTGAEPIVRWWYNPEQTTTSFMALSMIALAGLMVGVIHPAASIVREREEGTIEQLLVTPIRTGELFLAKTVPALGMGLLSVFPSLLIVRWFDVPLRGSLVTFLVLTGIFLLSAIGLGVLVAVVSRTLQQALLLAFFGLFPIMFLSGSLTPVESMPAFLQKVSLLSPLRYYMDIILGVFLKGAGWGELWPQAAALAGLGAVLFGVAGMVFRRQTA